MAKVSTRSHHRVIERRTIPQLQPWIDKVLFMMTLLCFVLKLNRSLNARVDHSSTTYHII